MGYVHSYACLVQIDKTEILAIGIILKELNLFIDYTQLDSSYMYIKGKFKLTSTQL